jgi:SAM-dependent methyltransferase
MMTDRQWYEKIVKSIDDPNLGLPGFPSVYKQNVFVGKSNEAALKEAFDFYQHVKRNSRALARDSKVLDFGVGWGRIIRFFTREVDASGLFGVDVDEDILAEAKQTGVGGSLAVIDKLGRLPYPDTHFDIVYAFSVFSHLSTNSASHWLKELIRVLKPGGSLVVTSTTDRFLDLCLACSLKKEGRNSYEEDYSGLFADPVEAIARYRRGEHVYSASSGNAAVLDAETYGWAAMPKAFVEREIGVESKSIEFIDDPQYLEQGVFTIRKRTSFFNGLAGRFSSRY